MTFSDDALSLIALFLFLTGMFIIDGLVWWAVFIGSVGLVMLAFVWYIWTQDEKGGGNHS
jgi:hypothetical protein